MRVTEPTARELLERAWAMTLHYFTQRREGEDIGVIITRCHRMPESPIAADIDLLTRAAYVLDRAAMLRDSARAHADKFRAWQLAADARVLELEARVRELEAKEQT